MSALQFHPEPLVASTCPWTSVPPRQGIASPFRGAGEKDVRRRIHIVEEAVPLLDPEDHHMLQQTGYANPR